MVMRKLLFVSAFVLSTALSLGQTTTVVFKPGAVVGKDAPIMKFDNDCIATPDTVTTAYMNYGSEETLWMKDWTWNAVGCSGGTFRSLLCFTELSTIPSNAVILSAVLRLYGVSSDRNTSYPGSPVGYKENSVVVQQITSPWDENTVTWNTQPSTTATNQFVIPQSTSQYDWNYSNSSAELVAMVQSMVSGNNYGFMLRLQTEQHYRNMVFASSNHPDSLLHPELEVTYKVCNPHFSMFMANSEHPNTITFSAFDQSGQHSWEYDGQILSTSASFTTSLNQTNSAALIHTLIKDGDTCTDCIKLCMGDIPRKTVEKPTESKVLVERGKVHLGDVIWERSEEAELRVVPNPTKEVWTVCISSLVDDEVELVLYNAEGRAVQTHKEKIKAGSNEIKLDCKSCADGLYIVSVKGKKLSFERSVVKSR